MNRNGESLRRADREPRCANCADRPGTQRWGDALAQTHGFAQMWCEVCVLKAQLAHARERADAIDALEQRLDQLERHDAGEAA